MSEYPEILADVVDDLTTRLADHVEPQSARKIAFEHAEYLRKHWGGQDLYIPKGVAWDLSERDRQMVKEFNGHNHDQLARKYNLTTVRVYQILKVAQREWLGKNQTDIFATE